MRRALILAVCLLGAALSARAQFVGGMIIRGGGDRAFPVTVHVADSLTAEAVPFASVYLKPEKDTIITNFTLSDSEGSALIDKVTRGSYYLHVEMMGYHAYRKLVYLTGRTDLGKVLLRQDAEMLEAARVSAAVRPLEVRQDTLIYHADAFSVRETDVLRDLLRQMPGIEVGENGSVKVQGETVSQITVNGKTFFMGDKQAALDNLPAKVVDKITVTDKDAEVEKLTGIRQGRGNNSKNMDISLKQEYAEGLFGNLQAFGGASVPGKEKNDMMASIPFLWNTSGMLSAYNKHDQLTLLARGQNVSAGVGLESMLGRGGITTGGQAGANYTTDRIKKVDTGVSVSYNGTSREDARRSFSQDFPLSGDTVESGSTSSSLSGNHRLNASVNFRSSGIKGISFSFSPQFTFSDARSDSQSASSSQVNGTESNSSSSLNTSHSRTLGTSGTLMVASNLFSKKGRSLRVIGNYALQGQQGTSRDYSLTSYAASHASSERDLHYENDGGNGNGVLNLFYVEPLADSWLFQSGVRGQVTRSRQDRAAFNADGSANDFYSNLSVNNSASGSGDFLLQYAKEDRSTVVQAGFSLSADHLYTYSRTQGRVTEIGEGEWLWNVAPVLRLTTPWFSLDYMGQSSQPSHSRMIAVPDITDPLRISTGNRYLRPGFDHMVALRRGPGRPDPQNPRRGSVQGAVQLHIRQNPVVSAVWYDADRIRYSIPVHARKPTLNMSGNLSGSHRFGKEKYWMLTYTVFADFARTVNYQPVGVLPGMDVQAFDYDGFMADFWGDASGSRFYAGESGFRESLTRQLGFRPDIELTYRKPETFRITLGNGVSTNHAWYSLDAMADTHTWIYHLTLRASYTTPHKFELATDYSLQRYFGYSETFSKWTNNLNFTLLKEYRSFTFSAQVRDVLNKGLSVSHSEGPTGTTDSYTLSLGRHFLAGVIWRFGKMGDKQLRRANSSASEIKMTFGR